MWLKEFCKRAGVEVYRVRNYIYNNNIKVKVKKSPDTLKEEIWLTEKVAKELADVFYVKKYTRYMAKEAEYLKWKKEKYPIFFNNMDKRRLKFIEKAIHKDKQLKLPFSD